MSFNYDELYGVDLDEYCRLHDTTINSLIRKSEIDIEIMYENLGRLMQMDLAYEEGHIIDTISFAIKKKEKHIFALRAWKVASTKLHPITS